MRDLLYHYTSEEGLKGIIENDNLRATLEKKPNTYFCGNGNPLFECEMMTRWGP